MIALLTGFLLSTAAGLNAYVPLLALGLLARFTNILSLPEAWSWLEKDWALITLTLLFIIEVVVDKVPALDTVNDVLQTIVRPASGGMVFSAGVGSNTVAISDPTVLTDWSAIWPFLFGIVVALVPHLIKAIIRPIFNTLSAGIGAPVLSTAEDTGAIGLTILAVVSPILGLFFLALLVWFIARHIARARLSRREPGPSESA